MKFRAKDIAEELGISPSTVSLVLNGKRNVSNETRRRVFSLIEKKGYDLQELYHPDQPENKSIYYIIYRKYGLIDNYSFFSKLLEGIDRQARKLGYSLIVMHLDERKDDIQDTCNQIENNMPAGMLLLASEMERDDLTPFINTKLPLVILDRYFLDEDVDSVGLNNKSATYKAIKALLKAGHREIGYLRDGQADGLILNFNDRLEGVTLALTESGIALNPDYVHMLGPTSQAAHRDMAEVLDKKPKMPTAFFADNDLIAAGAMQALKEYGCRVPDDVSVMGFDDLPICLEVEPNLSSINIPKERLGGFAVNRLHQIILEPVIERVNIEIGASIVMRESVRQIKHKRN